MGAKQKAATEKNRLISGELDLFLACGGVLHSICLRSFGRFESPEARLLKSLLSQRCTAARRFAAGVSFPSPNKKTRNEDGLELSMARAAITILKNYRSKNSRLILDLGLEDPPTILTILIAVIAGGLLFGCRSSKFDELPALLSLMDPRPSRWGSMMEIIQINCRSEQPLLRFDCSGRHSLHSDCQEIQLTAKARTALRLPVFAEEAANAPPEQSTARAVRIIRPSIRLEQVALSESLAVELKFFTETCRLGEGTPPVALFYGPPGTGKTYAASAIAGELGRPLAVVPITKILSKYVGEQEKNLESAFEEASAAKAVLLLDEADAFLMSRQFAERTYEVSTVNTLLSLLDPPGCPVILCTNLLPHLDEAVHRRVHHMIAFPVPDVAERERIWKLLLAEEGLGDHFACDLLAQVVLTGGLIHNAVSQARRKKALLGDKCPITSAVLLDFAFQETRKMPASRRKRVLGFGPAPPSLASEEIRPCGTALEPEVLNKRAAGELVSARKKDSFNQTNFDRTYDSRLGW